MVTIFIGEIMEKIMNKTKYIYFSSIIFMIALKIHSLFTEEGYHRMIVKKYYLWFIGSFSLVLMVLSLMILLVYLIFYSKKGLNVKHLILFLPSIVILLSLIFGW